MKGIFTPENLIKAAGAVILAWTTMQVQMRALDQKVDMIDRHGTTAFRVHVDESVKRQERNTEILTRVVTMLEEHGKKLDKIERKLEGK